MKRFKEKAIEYWEDFCSDPLYYILYFLTTLLLLLLFYTLIVSIVYTYKLYK